MTATDRVAEAVLELDRAIEQAATAGDEATLARLLADDFVYTHSTGKEESRSEWIAGLLALVGQRDRVLSGAKAEVHDDVAIVMGDLDIVWHSDRPRAFNRYVRVYRLVDGEWRAISQRTVPARDRAE